MIDAETIAALDALNEEGETDVVSEVFRLFLADAPARVTAIRTAAAGGDTAGLRRAAHALKGSAANVGAQQVRDVCLALEHGASAGRIDAALITSLDAVMSATEAAVWTMMADREARSGR